MARRRGKKRTRRRMSEREFRAYCDRTNRLNARTLRPAGFKPKEKIPSDERCEHDYSISVICTKCGMVQGTDEE